ncbi:hypothetical protein C1X65_02640 [Pseudomonas sp. FW305-70]|nr:hypothetical protein C1X65_02640 [Pseudomonas sp. FW305-70]
MGAGLLAKTVGQSTSMLNDKPPSRASPLPQGFGTPLAHHKDLHVVHPSQPDPHTCRHLVRHLLGWVHPLCHLERP